jgi:HD superfamily phosphohydrolase YqeK
MSYAGHMRTTINLAEDVAAAVEQLRRERAIGVSEAVNELARAGLTKQQDAAPFRQISHDLGRGIDVTNIADAIETLDGPAAR